MKRRLLVVGVTTWALLVALLTLVAMSSDRLLGAPVVAVPGFLPIGAVLAARRPGNPIGWLMLGIGSVGGVTGTLHAGPEVQNGLLIAGLAALLVLFPTGRPLSPVWWVPLGLVLVSWTSLGTLGTVRLAGGFGLPIGVAVAFGSLTWCGAGPIVRFRAGSTVERAQLRWLGAVVVLGMAGLIAVAVSLATGAAWLMGFAALGGAALVFGLPAAVLVAVTRYRLYEIDRLISRTITYTVVAAVAAAAYTLPVLAVTELLGQRSPVVIAGATLFALMLVSPVRSRVRSAVDRRFNRSSYDAMREIDSFATLSSSAANVESVRLLAVDVIGRALQPASMAIWTSSGSDAAPV